MGTIRTHVFTNISEYALKKKKKADDKLGQLYLSYNVYSTYSYRWA